MSQSVFVHWLPVMFAPEELRGGIAVVIDVLRASTTITKALSAGACAVVPCASLEEAQTRAANLPFGSCLLGGERAGVKIAGFDLGNSPLEYTPDMVGDKTVVFTTTNGTKALKRCEFAERIVIGSFVNLAAVAKAVVESHLPVHLVCAGTDGEMSAEDILCAGGLVAELVPDRGEKILTQSDAVRLAYEIYLASSEEGPLLSAIRNSAGGRNLRKLDYDADIQFAANRNRFALVPEYHRDTEQITVLNT